MGNLLRFITNLFSGYTILLMLLSAAILILFDRKQLKKAGLDKEAGFSLRAGILYVAVVLLVAAMGYFVPAE